LIGGEQEMIKAKPNENILCLRNRKGFVRLALETYIHLFLKILCNINITS